LAAIFPKLNQKGRCTIAAYARQAVARSSAGWTVAGNNATLTAIISFPAMASGAGGTVTYFGVGVALSGATQLVFFGTVTPNISVVNGVTPKLDTGTTITQASGDNLANAAATALMNLLFNNVAWAGFGDTNGLQPSAAAGSLYLSLHTAALDETMNQSQGELSYS
jgi:hypothetical protein